jgi:hypothetical protein
MAPDIPVHESASGDHCVKCKYNWVNKVPQPFQYKLNYMAH